MVSVWDSELGVTLSDVCAADGFLKTWRQKKKLLKASNFSFGHHVFNTNQLLFFHLKGFSVLLPRYFQSRLLQICCMWERVKQNPHKFSKEMAFNISNQVNIFVQFTTAILFKV